MKNDRLKIAWFTPFNTNSAIGIYSKYATDSLSEYADVDLFVVPKGKLIDTDLKLIVYQSVDIIRKLTDYDVAIYNLGDNYEYHALIYDVAQLHPGIIIDHDVSLQSFFAGYYLLYKKDEAGYFSILRKHYGKEVASEIIESIRSFNLWNKLDLIQYSMLDLLNEHAIGIICHSLYHQRILKQVSQLPNIMIPLIYPVTLHDTDSLDAFDGYDPSKINILTVGNINFNKRIHIMIKAMGTNQKLKENFNYSILGSAQNAEYYNLIKNEIRQYQLEDCVHLIGFAEQNELMQYYHHADLMLNLRYPAYEGASASLVEQMSFGKCIIVSDTGHYSDLPNDCVLKIDPDNEIADLVRILTRVLDDRSIIEQYGKNAHEYAHAMFSRDNYCEQFIGFIKQTLFNKPVFDLVHRMENELITMKLPQTSEFLHDLAAEVAELFEKGK